VSPAELAGFLAEINSAFPALDLREDEVTLVQRGLVPATVQRGRSPALRSDHEIRDHTRDGIAGALSAVTVKYTTARRVAEQAVDRVVQRLGRRTEGSRTATAELPGAEIADFEAILRESLRRHDVMLEAAVQRHLIDTYGSQVPALIQLIASRSEWKERVAAHVPTIGAEVIRAARHEMACTLTDAVLRRTTLGSAGYPGEEAARACATLMASELGWDAGRIDREVDELKRFYLPVGPLRPAMESGTR
jgi:glycerol-3-phosphate dehydrogenase